MNVQCTSAIRATAVRPKANAARQTPSPLLAAHREAVIRRAQRALLTVLLETGSATADDVRELVELPPGIDPKCFGAAPGVLARAKIIRADGFAKTCRPVGHARPVTVWELADRTTAERWLADHPDLAATSEAKRRGCRFARLSVRSTRKRNAGGWHRRRCLNPLRERKLHHAKISV